MTNLVPSENLSSTVTANSGMAGQAAHSWEAFNGAELTWYRHMRNVLHHIPMLRTIWQLRPKRVLEVGTGTGSHSIFLSYFLPQVLSIDLSRPLIERCLQHNRRLRGRAHFSAMDGFRLAFPDGAFDVAFSQGLLEHFEGEEIARLLDEQTRVAQYVVFSVPNRSYGVRDFGDERLLSREEWEDLLSSMGYQVMVSRDYAPMRARFWRGSRDMYLALLRRG